MSKTSCLAVAVFCLAIFALDASPAAAQTGQDSIVVALKPCRVYTGASLAANTTVNFKARGICNIPTEATAVFVQLLATGSSTDGQAHIWPFATIQPAVPQIHYFAGEETDERALVVLCDPEPECGTADLELRPSTTGNVYVNVEGYLKPLS